MQALLILSLVVLPGAISISCFVGKFPNTHVTEGHTFCGVAFNIVTNEAVFKGINVLDFYSDGSCSTEYSCKIVEDRTDGAFYVNCLCEEEECNQPRSPSEIMKRGFKMAY